MNKLSLATIAGTIVFITLAACGETTTLGVSRRDTKECAPPPSESGWSIINGEAAVPLYAEGIYFGDYVFVPNQYTQTIEVYWQGKESSERKHKMEVSLARPRTQIGVTEALLFEVWSCESSFWGREVPRQPPNNSVTG